jgi:hypothetical protein
MNPPKETTHMRISIFFLTTLCFVACGSSSSPTGDSGGPSDMSASAMDAGDMKVVTPYNKPGKVDCYQGLTCSTPGSTPICCDSAVDGGFTDTCVASGGCSGGTAYQCGQAADCTTGLICCGDIGTSKSGKSYFRGTSCAATCPSGNTQLCVTASECKASGVQCVGTTISGRDVGLCQ